MATLIVFSDAADAQPKPDRQIRIRHDLTSGRLATYRVVRTIRRTTPLPDGRGSDPRGSDRHVETLTWSETDDWVRFNMDESHPGRVKVAQMMISLPARVLALLHDDRPVQPLPSAVDLNLPRGSARLRTAQTTWNESPVQPPATDPAQQAMLRALIDVMIWPNERKQVGERWQRDIAAPGFRGTQSFELTDIFRKDDQTLLTITMQVEGAFAGDLDKLGFRFVSGASIITWSASHRVLRGLIGQAEYHQSPTDEPRDAKRERALPAVPRRQYDLKVDISLRETRILTDAAENEVRAQLADFAAILDEQRAGRAREAMRRCESFRARWPRSVWLPAVAHLMGQLDQTVFGPPPPGDDDVRDQLVQLVARWQAAQAQNRDDQLHALRRTFGEIADSARPQILRLTRHNEPNIRAVAVFALAFGETPANLERLHRAARDPSPRVRAWAAYGLALRADAATSADLLAELLTDASANVRARACHAVASCIRPTHSDMQRLRAMIVEIVLRDRADGARYHAADALAEIGASADVDVLQRAKLREVERPMRDHMQQALDRLKARLDTP